MFPVPHTILGVAVEVCVSVVLGLLTLSFLECIIHRNLMHVRALPAAIYRRVPHLAFLLNEHTVLHHATFYEEFDFEPDAVGKEQNLVIGPREIAGMALVLAPPLALVALVVSPIFAATFALLGLAHNVAWGFVHRQMHVPEQGSWFRFTRGYRFLARHHFLHHVYPARNYNVVLPCADFLLGKAAKPKLRHVKEMLRLGYLRSRTERGAARLERVRSFVADRREATLAELRLSQAPS